MCWYAVWLLFNKYLKPLSWFVSYNLWTKCVVAVKKITTALHRIKNPDILNKRGVFSALKNTGLSITWLVMNTWFLIPLRFGSEISCAEYKNGMTLWENVLPPYHNYNTSVCWCADTPRLRICLNIEKVLCALSALKPVSILLRCAPKPYLRMVKIRK